MKTELQRILSKRGIASRSSASKMILEGEVFVNGQVCLDPTKGFDQRVTIEILGKTIAHEKKHYLILNKPKGLVVSRSDEKGRATVYQCLDNWTGPLLQAVGRLDLASEGLLLFTNDHKWADTLMDPKTHVPKIYHVQVFPPPTAEILLKLSNGIMLEEKKTLPASFKILRLDEKNAWLEIELHEGRNRQIRKMLELQKIEVIRLLRVQIGNLKLEDLKPGSWKELNLDEVKKIT
jgi:23S rRNA pseudouridine2605 synthase